MPNGDDSPRIVIDETSFDFREVPGDQLTEFLDTFNDVLMQLRQDGSPAYKPPYFENVQCTDGHELYEYLASEAGDEVDRDAKFRFYSLVQKCPEWDASVPVCDRMGIDGGEDREAWSIAYALTMVLQNRGVACLALGLRERRGFLPIRADVGCAEVFFFAENGELPAFWRSLFRLENVAEQEFFVLADRAFPNLIFHEDLTFRRFQGAYRDLREPVVVQLAVLNDHFLIVYADYLGNSRTMKMAMAEHGCDGLSPESPKTRSNAAAMRLRDIEYAGKIYRCEWHMKIRPNVERIHFAFGGDLEDRILIGIFVDHLTV
ncbi:hypothetical protein SAMN05444920_101491 [Nonomuraea solani]|uniref:Uncharacterized protein n=1 Tax=Nonomuraea solani TaxID=1144553 RepID=A0A1H5UFM5_9ACTN|nr:hypothetical protein [Nonomuraea solani]SEF73087.1 hypothetical protein SAMN05444920_101491 [Nonomuraea solani]